MVRVSAVPFTHQNLMICGLRYTRRFFEFNASGFSPTTWRLFALFRMRTKDSRRRGVSHLLRSAEGKLTFFRSGMLSVPGTRNG